MDDVTPSHDVSGTVAGAGEYEEQTWVEMQEDEDDDINCLGMFDDPGE